MSKELGNMYMRMANKNQYKKPISKFQRIKELIEKKVVEDSSDNSFEKAYV
jgi:hypothetical protein